ncbi:MAG TPA: Rho termination factor N-terminal domain-containing protein [Solirubrobacteraceae bacterium]|nr:Rho termination factor N-terminal domain-containing protein [Solirubrobacteraceae bacterium]
MAVLDRSELEASPLADLHAIADQVGLEGFRRLRKADLIDAILGESGESGGAASDESEERPKARRRRAPRPRRGRREEEDVDGDAEEETEASADVDDTEEADDGDRGRERSPRRGRSRGGRGESAGRRSGRGGEGRGGESRGGEGRGGEGRGGEDREAEARVAEGVVEVLGNGSAFLRVDPPEPSDDDVYISAAQVRRCELVSGDRVSGPVRTPRRSERYPSLVRIDTINGTSADAVSDGARYEDLPVAWPTERLELGSEDKTLEAIQWLTPLGKGSRATIVGPRGAGKSETLRRLYEALKDKEGIEVSVVLAGVRPEEIADWQAESPAPVAALSFAASGDTQAQAVERALDAARRVAARGADAVVFIDGLDGLPVAAARRSLAAARNLKDAGSLTVVATASAPLGGETTVIALDPELAAGGGQPIIDLAASSTLRVELLVGEKDAEAIAKARAKALKG